MSKLNKDVDVTKRTIGAEMTSYKFGGRWNVLFDILFVLFILLYLSLNPTYPILLFNV